MNFKTIFLPAVVSVSMVYACFQINQALLAKTVHQERETATVMKWNQSYTALGTFEKKWQTTIPSASKIPDLASLIERTSIAPLSWPSLQKLSIVAIEERQDAYVYNVCLADGEGSGVQIQAASPTEAMAGLDVLSRRHDVVFNGVKLSADKEGTYLRFYKLCILLRGESDV